MVTDIMSMLRNYDSILPGIDDICDFIISNDLSKLDNGRYDVTDGIYCNVSVYEPQKEIDYFEAHRKYFDLQVIVKGDEFIEWQPIEGTDAKIIQEYSDENDCIGYGNSTIRSLIHLDSGMFSLFGPNDAHKPGLKAGSQSVKKAVFKIPVQH